MAGLFKGLGSVVNKAQAGMAAIDLDAKQKMKENTIKQQIQQLKSQRENVFARVGKEYYTAFKDDASVDGQFKEMFEILMAKENEIVAQEKQLEDIRAKYETEVRLLRGDGKAEAAAANCVKCGAPYQPGVTLFCAECGEDLRKPADTSSTCPNCGTPYDSAYAKFCRKCGHKLTEE